MEGTLTAPRGSERNVQVTGTPAGPDAVAPGGTPGDLEARGLDHRMGRAEPGGRQQGSGFLSAATRPGTC